MKTLKTKKKIKFQVLANWKVQLNFIRKNKFENHAKLQKYFKLNFFTFTHKLNESLESLSIKGRSKKFLHASHILNFIK
jgi:hypothetical protein